MYNRLIEFAEKFEILHYCQFGFRKRSLDITWVLIKIRLINQISSAIDQHKTTAGVFFDLSKAFDTLDHQILFAEL